MAVNNLAGCTALSISENYIKLTSDQAPVVSHIYADAWKNPEIPERQYEACVKKEIEDYRNGQPSAPFDAFIRLLKQAGDVKTLLDVGASSAYYSEVLKIKGIELDYTALDYSTYYKDLAGKLFPEVKFEIGSALELPFEDESFDCVLHGAVIMHVQEYMLAIREAARVSSRYVIFHRTPIYTDNTPTEAFVKTAYGVPCVEFHFNENELFRHFQRAGLRLQNQADVFMQGNFGHRSYLLSR